MIDQSMRFFPFWHKEDTSQVIGFLNMLNHIVSINPNIEHYVEIGSNIGESTTLLLGFPQIKNIYCVDIWQERQVKDYFDKRISTSQQEHKLKSFHTSSKLFADSIGFEVDVVYIDGDHEYKSVKEDIEVWYPKIKLGGFICGHDYNQKDWPGCKQAIDEFAYSNNLELTIFIDQSWVARKS